MLLLLFYRSGDEPEVPEDDPARPVGLPFGPFL